jgi:hypothetical protein
MAMRLSRAATSLGYHEQADGSDEMKDERG